MKVPFFGLKITQQMKQKLLKYAPELQSGASSPTNGLLGALRLGPSASWIGNFPRAAPPSKREVDSYEFRTSASWIGHFPRASPPSKREVDSYEFLDFRNVRF